MWQARLKRVTWLNPQHPIAIHDTQRIPYIIPRFVYKLVDLRTMLGYAAILHGVLFIIGLGFYDSVQKVFPGLLTPFFTPFGTVIAAGILHSVLYWVMLIGVINYTTYLISSEMETGTWGLLRTTPYSTTELILVKIGAVGHMWYRVLRALVATRVVFALIIPLAVLLDKHEALGFDVISALLFIFQPVVDMLLVASLSALGALLIRNVIWSRIYAYGMSATIIGGLSTIASGWLIFTSPIGSLAALLVPVGHWAFFLTALTNVHSLSAHFVQLLILLLTHILLPLSIAYIAFRLAVRMAHQTT